MDREWRGGRGVDGLSIGGSWGWLKFDYNFWGGKGGRDLMIVDF
jgi:hypothetical protein